MKYKTAGVIFLTSILRALAPLSAVGEDTSKLLERTCQIDPAFCDRAQANISSKTAEQLKLLRPVVWQAAKLYGVRPEAIVGSILAEHSMNTGTVDIAQDELVRSGLAPTGVFAGRKFSFGFGQLHWDRAQSVEKLCANVEDRPERTDRQVSEAILTPEGSIFYVAALIQQAQSLYGSSGYDIKDNLGILTTLYNIGKIHDRLERTTRERRLPEPNYFGTFVEINRKTIEQITGSDPAPKAPPVAVTPADSGPTPSLTEKSNPTGLQPTVTPTMKAEKPLTLEPQTELFTLNANTPFLNAPPNCLGVDEKSVPPGNQIRFEAGTQLKMIDARVDCDSQGWVLLQTPTGKAGWIQERDLRAQSGAQLVPTRKCKSVPLPECTRLFANPEISKFRSKDPLLSAGSPSTKIAEYSLNFGITNGIDAQGFSLFGLADVIANSFLQKELFEAHQNLASSRLAPGGLRTLSKAEKEDLIKVVGDFRSRVARELKVPYVGPSNPYSSLLSPRLAALTDCLENDDCAVSPKAWKNWLEGMKIKLNPSPNDILPAADIEASLRTFRTGGKLNNTHMDINDSYQSEIVEPLAQCYENTRGLPKTRMVLEELISNTTTIAQYEWGKRLQKAKENALTLGVNLKNGLSSRIYKDWIGNLKRTFAVSLKVCESMRSLCINKVSPDPQIDELFPSCTSDVWIGTELKKQNYSVFLKMFPTPADQDIYFSKAIKESQSKYVDSDQLQTIFTIRELADQLAANSCEPVVYVPYPWLATRANQVVRKVRDQPSRVWQDSEGWSCQP